MQFFVKLLAVYLAVGQSSFGAALPLDERSPCELTDTIRLNLRDAAFASEWTKRCASPEIIHQTLEKRGSSPPGYGGDTTTSTPSSTKDTTATSSSTIPGSPGGYGGSSSTSTTTKDSTTIHQHCIFEDCKDEHYRVEDIQHHFYQARKQDVFY
ncbi:hypothetical protein LTR86_000896 [Recurvomyces mirabilis]|nr:hypothetical protein LTR86_000896 [Recurvomyces mirabilis]